MSDDESKMVAFSIAAIVNFLAIVSALLIILVASQPDFLQFISFYIWGDK